MFIRDTTSLTRDPTVSGCCASASKHLSVLAYVAALGRKRSVEFSQDLRFQRPLWKKSGHRLGKLTADG